MAAREPKAPRRAARKQVPAAFKSSSSRDPIPGLPPAPLVAAGSPADGSGQVPRELAEAVVTTAAKNATAKGKDRPPSTPASRQQEIQVHFLKTGSQRVKDLEDAITAAAMVMDPTKAPSGGFPAPNAVTRTWQHAAWGYTRSVPELNAAMMFIGNCLSRCKLVVGQRNPDGSVEQGFDGDEPKDENGPVDLLNEAAEYINDLQMPRGGQSEMLRSFGEKIFVAGECYIVPEDLPTGLVFEVLSTQELMPEGNKYKRYYGPGWGTDDLPPDTKPIRVWRADGQYQMLSSSSVRACLEILEELVVLTRLVRAAAISRMSLAGVLVVPDELDTPDSDGDADGNNAEAKNPLLVDMINTGAKAIDDPASAAAWMPFLLQGPAEFIQHVRHIPFQTDDQENVIKRTEAVERLARGLDLPPEKVLGHMGTTYANAGQISEDNFNLYIEPALQMICDALTITYLWPAMALARGIDAEHLGDSPFPDDVMQVAITYDARRLISKPDRTKEIIEVFTKDMTFMTVGIGEMREAIGLDPSEDSWPTDKEVAKRIDAYRLGRIREVIPAPPSDAAVPIEDASAGNAVVPGASGGAAIAGTSGKVAEAAAAAKAKAGATPADKVDQQAVEDAIVASAALDPLRFLAVKIAGTAELTVDRALEKMGARIRNKARGANGLSDTEKDAISGVGNGSVARVLGPTVVGRILPDLDEPMLAEVTMFTRKVAQWAREAECEDDTHVAGEAAAVVMTLARHALFHEPLDVSAELFGEPILGVRVGV
jgi:hypothetical protein